MAVPPIPMGGGIAQVLQRLLQDPNAVRGMQNYMQGMPPTAGMEQPGAMPPEMVAPGGPPPTSAGMGPRQSPPEMPDDQTPPIPPGMGQGGRPDPAEQMAQGAIDTAGQTWDGVDAPTKGDLERLAADPSPQNIKSFDAQFGQGMAEKYLESESTDAQQEPDADDQGGNSADEYGQ